MLFKDLFADESGIRVSVEKIQGRTEQLLKFAHERDGAAVTHKNCRTASQVRHGNESKPEKKKKKEGSVTFFLNE